MRRHKRKQRQQRPAVTARATYSALVKYSGLVKYSVLVAPSPTTLYIPLYNIYIDYCSLITNMYRSLFSHTYRFYISFIHTLWLHSYNEYIYIYISLIGIQYAVRL